MTKQLWAFLCAMLLCTLLSCKLYELRTPVVECVTIRPAVLEDTGYPCTLPTNCLVWEDGQAYCYVADGTALRKAAVYLLAESDTLCAVEGDVSGGEDAVLYSTLALTADTETVRRDDGRRLGGIVELYIDPAVDPRPLLAEYTLAKADTCWQIADTGLFSAQQITQTLLQNGVAAEQFTLRDYSWAAAFVRQCYTLWLFPALLVVWALLCRALFLLGKAELSQAEFALQKLYFKQYLTSRRRQLAVSLVKAAALLCLLAAVTVCLVRIPLFVPPGFLPSESLFRFDHYCSWLQQTFPADGSAYSRALLTKLQTGLVLSAAATATVILAGLVLNETMKRKSVFVCENSVPF